MATRIQRRNNM